MELIPKYSKACTKLESYSFSKKSTRMQLIVISELFLGCAETSVAVDEMLVAYRRCDVRIDMVNVNVDL